MEELLDETLFRSRSWWIDPGAVGNGLREKDITLDIAQKIQSI